MARYIDADRITLPQGFFEKVDNVPKFYEWLSTIPTADVVEVVRCKDCKNHDWCSMEDTALNDETFFCKWGERRE